MDELPWLAIQHEYCHASLPGEVSTAHNSSGRGQLEVSDVKLSWTLSFVLLPFSSIQPLSHPNSLRPHKPQHARPPCPSPTQWTWVWANFNAPIELPAYKIQESPKLISSWHQLQNSAIPITTLTSDTNYKFPRLQVPKSTRRIQRIHQKLLHLWLWVFVVEGYKLK